MSPTNKAMSSFYQLLLDNSENSQDSRISPAVSLGKKCISEDDDKTPTHGNIHQLPAGGGNVVDRLPPSGIRAGGRGGSGGKFGHPDVDLWLGSELLVPGSSTDSTLSQEEITLGDGSSSRHSSRGSEPGFDDQSSVDVGVLSSNEDLESHHDSDISSDDGFDNVEYSNNYAMRRSSPRKNKERDLAQVDELGFYTLGIAQLPEAQDQSHRPYVQFGTPDNSDRNYAIPLHSHNMDPTETSSDPDRLEGCASRAQDHDHDDFSNDNRKDYDVKSVKRRRAMWSLILLVITTLVAVAVVVGVTESRKNKEESDSAKSSVSGSTTVPTSPPTVLLITSSPSSQHLRTSKNPTLQPIRMTNAPSKTTPTSTISPSLVTVTAPPSIPPTSSPTQSPSIRLTQSPSGQATLVPSTQVPSVAPTFPTTTPTVSPSFVTITAPPSIPPTSSPTQPPSLLPTQSPSVQPTFVPSTQGPSVAPTSPPSISPSKVITMSPTFSPTSMTPSQPPTPTSPPRPKNDQCVGALGLQSNGVVEVGTTAGAVESQVIACGSSSSSSTSGVWFTVMGTGEIFNASTCHDVTNVPTMLSIYTGTCDALSCIDSNYRGFQTGTCPDGSQTVSWLSQANVLYYMFVHGNNGTTTTETGSFGLNVIATSNSESSSCNNTSVDLLTVNGLVTLASTSLTNVVNGTETCLGDTRKSGYGAWFRMNGTGGLIQVDTCNSGSSLATTISVYSGNDCYNLVCVAGRNENSCGIQSSVSWTSKADSIYRILVVTIGQAGYFSLTVSSA